MSIKISKIENSEDHLVTMKISRQTGNTKNQHTDEIIQYVGKTDRWRTYPDGIKLSVKFPEDLKRIKILNYKLENRISQGRISGASAISF